MRSLKVCEQRIHTPLDIYFAGYLYQADILF